PACRCWLPTFLREAVPALRRLAILLNVGYRASVLEADELQASARRLGLEVALMQIGRAEDIVPAFQGLERRADGLIVVTDSLMSTNRVQINTLALAAGLPAMHGAREYLDGGGLISY